ncbi:MAG: DoxX family protein [Streptosporangiaceae bacterium]
MARPMLASIFVVQGLDTFQHPEKVSAKAEPVVRPLADRFPAVPAQTEQAVRLNGAVQVAAGTMLGLGILPRLSALALAGTLVPTTLAGHRYWELEDPAERAQQRIHFLENLTMLGGLLIAAADTGGAPSLGWRRRQAARRAGGVIAGISDSAAATGDLLASAAHNALGSVSDSAAATGDLLASAAHNAAGSVTDSAAATGDLLTSAAHTAAGSLADSAALARDRLPELSHAAVESARSAGSQVARAAQTAIDAGRSEVRQLAG